MAVPVTYTIDEIVARGNDTTFGDVTIITDVNTITTLNTYEFTLVGEISNIAPYYIYTSTPGITINGGVIATDTFINNSNIIGIFLSKSITEINNAFNSMSNLQYIQILNSVTYIHPDAFIGCTKLKTYASPYEGTLYTSLYATSVTTSSVTPSFFGIGDGSMNGFYLNIVTTPADSYILTDIVNRGVHNPTFGDITIGALFN